MNAIEWIFSGIGVVIVVALVSPLRKYFLEWADSLLRKFPFFENKQIEAWIRNKSYNTRPSPTEIMQGIRKLPPAQRENAMLSYRGLRVAWSLKFFGLDLRENGLVKVTLHHDISSPLIYFEVPLRDYPQLNIYQQDQVVWIAGEIESVERLSINLMNCRLQFLE
jgi:hypothetical protein